MYHDSQSIGDVKMSWDWHLKLWLTKATTSKPPNSTLPTPMLIKHSCTGPSLLTFDITAVSTAREDFEDLHWKIEINTFLGF